MAPAAMSDEEINRLSSSLREVILFIRDAADKGKMAELMKQNDRFRPLDRQATNVINVLMNCGLEIDEEEGEVDMCIAWEEMKKDARMEGEQRGIEKGKRPGLEQGTLTFIANLMVCNGWSMEQAKDTLKIPGDEQIYYAKELRS